ncbi:MULTISPECIES: hypothetical protein [unclassified Micromonospora]|uniref:hypothetical protein n=1 Tax=Micromonospora sp. NPDC005087 TaxID=3364225 RepID=UPI00369922AE
MSAPVALGDVLLVLLNGQPSNAFDLHQRHTLLLGPEQAVDIRRFTTTVNRLARSGHVRLERVISPHNKNQNRPRCVLTAACQHRQQSWLTDVTEHASLEEIYTKGILAVDSADLATFEAFISTSLAAAHLRQRNLTDATAEGSPAMSARLAFEDGMIKATATWLRHLSNLRPSAVAAPSCPPAAPPVPRQVRI